MEFPTRDVKGLTYETMLKLRDANWVADKSSNATDLSGSITARQKGRMLTLWISKNSDGHVPGFLLIQETNF